MAAARQKLKNLKAPVDWQLQAKVGDGTFGSVYKLKSKKSGQLAAVKIVESVNEKSQEEVFHELEILKNVSNHPNIVQFLGAYRFKLSDAVRTEQLWLVMELCRGGCVTALVKRLIRQGSRLNEDLISYITHETLQGLGALHEKNIIHRDIKGANILLTSNAGVKLVDFGVSARLSNAAARRHSSVGTPYWMSPEVIACDQQLEYSYDNRCDVWSLGITIIELADGSPPLSVEHPMRALFKIPRNPPPTVKLPSKWSKELNDFVANCAVKDFERRPFVDGLLKHKFVQWVNQNKNELQQKLKSVMVAQYGGLDGVDCDNSWYLSPVGAHRDQWRDKKMLGVDDLVTLENLTEETILTHIMERYLGDQIYTYIGDILIAVNPFKNLPIYDIKHSLQYRNIEKKEAPPHIFAIADTAYRAMIINQQQQCCLISGESGAGKTVSSNFLVQQLAELGKGGNSKLEKRILQVNPLMEALGNAQTGINDNSSRFGKYLELHFTPNGYITGARLVEYLLEKSRVVSQAKDERNFHVFYYFLAGMWRDGELAKYNLKLKAKYRYMQTGNQSLEQVLFTTENKQKYEEFRNALKIIGFTQEETSDLFAIIAAIIHIGDIDFIEDDSDRHFAEHSKVKNFHQLQIIASLLRVNDKELSDALTTSSNVTRGETISRRNTVQKSQDCRDAMAKSLYDAMFIWIVERINHLLSFETNRQSNGNFKIGILDIFGFENVQHNTFEQLFINIANEQIQYFFNQYIFSMEMNEYVKEDIPATRINMSDNKHMIELFLQRPIGLLALLDEESGFPKATDTTLLDKFNANISSKCYQQTREVGPSFTIKHFAGEVTYDARGFLEKNRDTMSSDILHVLRTSAFSLLRAFFTQRYDVQTRRMNTTPQQRHSYENLVETVKPLSMQLSLPYQHKSMNSVSRRQQTLSMTFRSSLEDLLLKLTKACPHFVRCIKPNDKKMADQFNQERVMTQLRYTGVLETTRLRKEGYSERITFKEFVRRYQLVLFHMNEKVRPDALTCKTILRATGLENWLVGKTKIFLKYHHVEKMAKILEKYRHSVILVQRAVRAWLQRRHWLHTYEKRTKCAIVLQKVYRGRLVRKKYGYILNKREKSATSIQKVVRRWLAVKKYKTLRKKREQSAIKVQSVYRGFSKRKAFQKEIAIRREIVRAKQAAAAQKITAVARGFQGRKEFGKIKDQSSQMETKMIYFLQQVSYLSEEFHNSQTRINAPVPAKDRRKEPTQVLFGAAPGSYKNFSDNMPAKYGGNIKYNMQVKQKKIVPPSPPPLPPPPPPPVEEKRSDQRENRQKEIQNQNMSGPSSLFKVAKVKIEAIQNAQPLASGKTIQGYKVNPLIAGEKTEHVTNNEPNDVIVVDATAKNHGNYRIAWKPTETKTSVGTVVNYETKRDTKDYSKEFLGDSNKETNSGNVLLVRNPANLRHVPSKVKNLETSSRKNEQPKSNYKKLNIVNREHGPRNTKVVDERQRNTKIVDISGSRKVMDVSGPRNSKVVVDGGPRSSTITNAELRNSKVADTESRNSNDAGARNSMKVADAGERNTNVVKSSGLRNSKVVNAGPRNTKVIGAAGSRNMRVTGATQRNITVADIGAKKDVDAQPRSINIVETEPVAEAQAIHITADVPCYNLRAKLRKTGQIEETSGLHKHDVRRQHIQVVV